MAPETLVYLLGGYSGTTAQSISYNFLGFPAPLRRGNITAPTFGGGFERFFTDSISARAEYRVTHLGARDDLASIS